MQLATVTVVVNIKESEAKKKPIHGMKNSMMWIYRVSLRMSTPKVSTPKVSTPKRSTPKMSTIPKMSTVPKMSTIPKMSTPKNSCTYLLCTFIIRLTNKVPQLLRVYFHGLQ